MNIEIGKRYGWGSNPVVVFAKHPAKDIYWVERCGKYNTLHHVYGADLLDLPIEIGDVVRFSYSETKYVVVDIDQFGLAMIRSFLRTSVHNNKMVVLAELERA